MNQRIKDLIRKLDWLAQNCTSLLSYKRAEIAEALVLARQIERDLLAVAEPHNVDEPEG
jgi:hypothetical protein